MTIARIQELIHRIAGRLTWLPPAVVRLTLGVTFVLTGWGKLHGLDQLTQYFTELGIPAAAIQAPMVAGIEFFGGLMILLGLGTRFAAVPLMGTMIVAILTAKLEDIHGLGDLVGTTEFAYLAMFLWLAVAGGGMLSVDHVIGKLLRRNAGTSAAPASAAPARS
jgi:putative oxidoreductase